MKCFRRKVIRIREQETTNYQENSRSVSDRTFRNKTYLEDDEAILLLIENESNH
jgi:hypothetical protein